MTTPLNREIYDYRVRIQQYNRVLKIDKQIKNGEINNPDDRPLLNDEEIKDIENKISLLTEQLNGLLAEDNDFSEVNE